MVLTIALCTCGPQLEVALEGGSLRGVSLVRMTDSSLRSSLVLAAVDLLVEDAGAPREALESVVVSRGPGSFTGIRSGLATAHGLALALGLEARAYDSLLAHAARAAGDGIVWSAQPGRRGELYVQPFQVADRCVPQPAGDVRVMAVADSGTLGPWVAPETLDIGAGARAQVTGSCAEGLLRLCRLEAPGQALEPLYVEGPPAVPS